MKCDQNLCLNLWYDLKSYFGKINSTLGSVVPLAMFSINSGISTETHLKSETQTYKITWATNIWMWRVQKYFVSAISCTSRCSTALVESETVSLSKVAIRVIPAYCTTTNLIHVPKYQKHTQKNKHHQSNPLIWHHLVLNTHPQLPKTHPKMPNTFRVILSYCTNTY